MRASIVTGPGETTLVDVATPAVGPRDVLVKMRACGICGTDSFYISAGGLPPRQGKMPLGHEPAGEVVDVGSDVTGISVGDHVAINKVPAPSGIIGNGGMAQIFSRPKGELHWPWTRWVYRRSGPTRRNATESSAAAAARTSLVRGFLRWTG